MLKFSDKLKKLLGAAVNKKEWLAIASKHPKEIIFETPAEALGRIMQENLTDSDMSKNEDNVVDDISDKVKPLTKPVLQGKHIDTLVALVERGPCESGDVPSKSGRDDLIDWGYAINTLVKGEGGYHAVTLLGMEAYCEQFDAATVAEAIERRRSRFNKRDTSPNQEAIKKNRGFQQSSHD